MARNFVFTCPAGEEVQVSAKEVTPSSPSTGMIGYMIHTGRERYSGKKLETQRHLLGTKM